MKVYFVGAGPGGTDLITVRGLEILRQADCVIYDYLVDKRLLDEAKEGAELVCCDTLGKKRYSDEFAVHQERINGLMVRKAKAGKKVIRLKNGDVSVFSRLSQELEVLARNRIAFEVVPGVTAGSAAAAFSGIPLTDRRFASSVIFVTGHEDHTKKTSSVDWGKIAGSGTIVLYMALANLAKIVKGLLAAGRPRRMPVALIKDAGCLTQKAVTGTLADIVNKARSSGIIPPVIIIVGEVVKLRRRFDWLGRAKKILYTGISKERFFEDARYFHIPLIKLVQMGSYKEFDNYLKKIANFDWIIFTSRYGVEYFFKRLHKIPYDARALNGINIAAIGNSTNGRLLDFGVMADLVPKKESSEGLRAEFQKVDLKGKKIFLPRSDISDKGLNAFLAGLGAEVTEGLAYRNIARGDLPELDIEFFDEIFFTSPSTVRSFKARYKKIPRGVKVRCIGDVTLREAKKFGYA